MLTAEVVITARPLPGVGSIASHGAALVVEHDPDLLRFAAARPGAALASILELDPSASITVSELGDVTVIDVAHGEVAIELDAFTQSLLELEYRTVESSLRGLTSSIGTRLRIAADGSEVSTADGSLALDARPRSGQRRREDEMPNGSVIS